jgi:hypothetical protein
LPPPRCKKDDQRDERGEPTNALFIFRFPIGMPVHSRDRATEKPSTGAIHKAPRAPTKQKKCTATQMIIILTKK